MKDSVKWSAEIYVQQNYSQERTKEQNPNKKTEIKKEMICPETGIKMTN